MGYTIERLSSEPIVITHLTPPLNAQEDLGKILGQVEAILNETEGTLFYISDTSQVDIEFSDMVVGMAQATRGETLLANPRLKLIVVAVSPLFKLAAEAMQQEQYGAILIPVFASVDEALAAARKEIQQLA